MGVQVAGTYVHWSWQLQPTHAPSSSSHILASVFSSLSSRRNGCIIGGDRALTYHLANHPRSPFLGAWLLPRTRSLEIPKGSRRRRREHNLWGACSGSLESFAGDDGDEEEEEEEEEEFVKRLQELADINSASRTNHDAKSSSSTTISYDDAFSSCYSVSSSSLRSSSEPSIEPPWLSGRPEPPDWLASVERNASSVDMPLSLRIIKRKKKGSFLREAGESACCSVMKAFSSMVFIVRELHSFALQMRWTLLYEDLQGILVKVQQEIHTSFVWLFQRIFSCTPTLMVSLMLLLANYTVYSMGHSTSIAAAAAAPNSSPPHQSAVVTVVDDDRQQSNNQPGLEPSYITRRMASVGGGGGGKVRPVAGATDDGRSDGSSSSSYRSRTILPDGISVVMEGGTEGEGSAAETEEEAARVRSRIVEEASIMHASMKDGALMDPDTLKRLVAPVSVDLEPEDYSEYLRTELNYRLALAQEPDNPLLLSNFGQFLYLVLHDHERAEHYFKRAVRAEPADAEALSRYAIFLWLARKDLAAAEETYLEAIAADPGNTAHAANYAHFLWSTGGEDTCYPPDGDVA
ncbi:uncharacterized protein LOC103704041 [Phoenix dactylifera]|uniref:Uncharacterized protein LOC103704041 n=1 Tax=Phoenix dactylifera TaxID=42345 RepID=A0A8B7BU46_PHODC|nr:uncharacterized protein LOC103704041 [Phoenix dactylifera]